MILWLVLTEGSRKALRDRVPPRYTTTYYHHVTLQFGQPLTAETGALVGTKRSILVYSIAWNAVVQAVRVNTNGLPDQYGAPHITLSTAPGVDPFASVAMLHGNHVEEKLDEALTLEGVIKCEDVPS